MGLLSPSTSTSLDPAQAGRISTIWNRALTTANQPYTPYTGNTVAALTPDQIAAQTLLRNGINSNVGGSALTAAQTAATKAANYNPLMVNAPTLPSAARVAAANAGAASLGTASVLGPATTYAGASIDRDAIRQAEATQGADYMQRYMNPWLTDVVNTSLADLDRARQMSIINGEDAAIRSGGYGGSRHGVADSLTNEAALRQAASTAANLRMQGFNTAANLGMTDADRFFQGRLADQSYDASVLGQNAGFQQQAGLANAAAQNQYGITQAQLNDSMSQFNAGAQNQMAVANAQMAQQAAMANAAAKNQFALATGQMGLSAAQGNQTAGLQGANLGLSAANALNNISGQQISNLLTRSAGLDTIGTANQNRNQRVLDARYNTWMQRQNEPYRDLQTLMAAAGFPAGTTTTSTPSTMSQVGQTVNTIGGLLSLLP